MKYLSGFILIILCISVSLAQSDTTSSTSARIFLGIGITVNGLVHESNTGSGSELKVNGWLEYRLLQNMTFSTGVGLSFSSTSVGNNVPYTIPQQDSFLLFQERIGEVSIQNFNLNVPLRFRLFYFTTKKIRIFVDPGFFFTTELNSRRIYTFEQTTFYDTLNQQFFPVSRVEQLEEDFDFNKSTIGVSLGTGLQFSNKNGQVFVFNIFYQRSRLYYEPRKSITSQAIGLETRIMFGPRSRRITETEQY